MNKIHLITTYYKAKEIERELENEECLRQNINNPHIHQIHLFLEGKVEHNQLNHPKVIKINHGSRPTFEDLFALANKLDNEDIKIIANSDIYFDSSIEKCARALKKWDVLALTRWNFKPNQKLSFFKNFKTQDTWIFRTKIHSSIGKFFIGQLGCDNRLLYEFKANNLRVGNPSFSIKTIHLHRSDFRNYLVDPNYIKVDEPYGYILPSYIYFNPKQYCNYKFVTLRYQYHKSRMNNTLHGAEYNLFERFFSFFMVKLYAFLVNIKK